MLLSGQRALPRLPVPILEHTLAKLLRTLEPLCSAEEVRRIAESARDFASSVGPKLQDLLVKRDKQEENSWLERWWNAIAYLAYRDCVPINSNFHMTILAEPPVHCPVKRAALLSRAMFEFKTLIDERTLPPDAQPLDQLPYTLMFGACRVPASVCDVQRRFPPEQSRHLVVVFRDSFWVIEDAQTASIPQLEAAFRAIRASGSESPGTSSRVGVLTFSHRDSWAASYPLLRAHGDNASLLDTIHSAAFFVCFDDARPVTLDERCALVLHGDGASCSNRWFDKPLQLIVFANGAAGLNGEHSPVDGQPVSRMMDWIVEREKESLAAPSLTTQKGPPLTTRPLHFKLNELLLEHIRVAHAFALRQINGVRLHQLRFTGFGKLLITKLGVSPDAWCQAATQLAYYRLHGHFAPAYESASTRQHLAGRTETGRSLTPELAHFITQHEARTLSEPDLRALFEKAAKAHVAYMRDAVRGHGVDRHLLALRLLSKESGLNHPFLSDQSVLASSHWKLSTSQLGVSHICIGFGPVVPDGYGVCYQIHKASLHFSLASFVNDLGTDCFKLADGISQALTDLRMLFTMTPSSL